MTMYIVCDNKKELNTFVRVISDTFRARDISHKLNPLKEFIAKQHNYNTFAAMLTDLPFTTKIDDIWETTLEPLYARLTDEEDSLIKATIYGGFMRRRHALHLIETISPEHYNNTTNFGLSIDNKKTEWELSLDECIARANALMKDNPDTTVSVFERCQGGSSRITKCRNTTLILKASKQPTPCYSCNGKGTQSSTHGADFPDEPCGLCHGDKHYFKQPDTPIKLPRLSRH